ncbi:MAG TPA: hypothetical protein VM910_19085 [Bradyrhizobium sp.]|jgi:hypothetical protein|nr:hypothetical protein [Bradyrhizobium sp.]
MARRAAAKRYAPDAFGLARRKDIGASAALSLHGFAAVDNTTMLALTDAQLAHLAIAATAVEERRRRGWLKDVAERIDRPPRRVASARARKARQRARQPSQLGAPIILPSGPLYACRRPVRRGGPRWASGLARAV